MSKAIKDKIRQQIVYQYSNVLSREKIDENQLRIMISRVSDEIAQKERLSISEEEKKKIISELMDYFVGYGPIEQILKDPAVNEVMINGYQSVYVERAGKRELTGISFDDEQQLMHIIQKILGPTRRRVDETTPYTEVSLKDGSRVNIVIPPLALDGPVVTIRKFSKEIKTVEDLIGLGTLDRRMADFLIAAIRAKLNIIFCGPTGAGKTTALNVLSSYIPNDERIITIEDTAELRLSQDHVVRLESRQVNIEGKGEILIRELFKNSLRMRPDRIILGEIRGNEALDMLQAILSGHTGSLCVIHANSPQDLVYRIEMMTLSSGIPISLDIVHRQIASAINLIVQHDQDLDGTRKISHISQINGLKDNRVKIEDIFVYEMESVEADGKVKGRWVATGIVPAAMELFRKAGITLPQDLFKNN